MIEKNRMKYAILSIAVAIALFASFIYGVEFGRKVEHEALVNANKVSAASVYTYGSYYAPSYGSNYTTDEEPSDKGTDYTP